MPTPSITDADRAYSALASILKTLPPALQHSTQAFASTITTPLVSALMANEPAAPYVVALVMQKLGRAINEWSANQ